MDGSKESLLSTDAGDGVRLLTLNRPDRRNAFTTELYFAFAEALRSADRDSSVGALVLTGAGTAFCAGVDLGELEQIAAGETVPGAGEAFNGVISTLSEIEVPLVAAVNGAGVGFGYTILSFCDLVYIAESARLKAPFVELGVPPEAASSYLLPARMGWQRAALSLLTAEWLSAEEAVSAGMAVEVCEDGSVLETALRSARRIAASPAAARTAKSLMQAAQRDAVAAAIVRETAAYGRLFGRGH